MWTISVECWRGFVTFRCDDKARYILCGEYESTMCKLFAIYCLVHWTADIFLEHIYYSYRSAMMLLLIWIILALSNQQWNVIFSINQSFCILQLQLIRILIIRSTITELYDYRNEKSDTFKVVNTRKYNKQLLQYFLYFEMYGYYFWWEKNHQTGCTVCWNASQI